MVNSRVIFRGRLAFVTVAMLLGFVSLAVRVVDLTILDRDFLQSHGDAISLRHMPIKAYRGKVFDRNGSVLALSTPVVSVWVDPTMFQQVTSEQLKILGRQLSMSTAEIQRKVRRHLPQHFVYLKRHLAPSSVVPIKALHLPGLHLIDEFKRFYPLGEMLAPVLGFTDIDDKGIEGLEYALEQYLRGAPGLKRVMQDREGQPIDEVGVIRAPQQGQDVHLTIDKDIQYITYRYLKEYVSRYAAESGSIIVMDVNTGELLAVGNYPSFNPNQPVKRRDQRYRNRALTDIFEPGSVIKPFSVASALDSGLFRPDTVLDIHPGWMRIGKNLIQDDRPQTSLTVTEILKQSSNMGVTKMVLASPAKQYLGLLKRVGFGQSSGSGFPGEAIGKLPMDTKHTPFELATMGFGYGLSVTTLQLTQAYAVFANQGRWLPAKLVRSANSLSPFQAISPQVAADLLNMLEAVVQDKGTGRQAAVQGYRVAGKTGTARVASLHGYDKHKHIASFVGMSPVSHPQVVIAVVIRAPSKTAYYGGAVAAPLFRDVMSEVLKIRGILPDMTTTSAT